MSILENNIKPHLAFHHSNLEAVIVPVISNSVMDLGWTLSLFPFLLGILVIRAA